MENKESIEEFTAFIRESLFPDENMAIDKGLELLCLSFEEVFLRSLSLIDQDTGETISINHFPAFLRSLIPQEKSYNFGPVEDEILTNFNKALLRLPMIMEEYFIEKNEIEKALELRKVSLKTIVKIDKRISDNDTPEYIISHIKEGEESIEKLEKSISPLSEIKNQLFWNGTHTQLKMLSKKLYDNSTTSSEHEFANVFYNQSKCGIRKGDKVFFVLLFYLLSKNPDPLKPKYITAKAAVIEVGERFFYDKSKEKYGHFSFRRLNSKIGKDRVKSKQITTLVENFIKGVL